MADNLQREDLIQRNIECTLELVDQFYKDHREIKASHGISHVMAVYNHAIKAIQCHKHPTITLKSSMEIKISTLLHDVDDEKYFPKPNNPYENARNILSAPSLKLSKESIDNILYMIQLVSCSSNGNSVPDEIIKNESYHLLIPRWSDRLEAVGRIGVVRCYQYNRENDRPLYSELSPKATTPEQVWEYANPQRFIEYQSSGGRKSVNGGEDMISHYYDKLLHVSRPPRDIVRNSYLEQMAESSSQVLVEVCIRFGKTGFVDEDFIHDIAKEIGIKL